MQAAIRDLKSLLDQRATTAEVVREHHSHGESYHPAGLPDAVCFPVRARSQRDHEDQREASGPRDPVRCRHVHGSAGERDSRRHHIDMREMNKVIRISAEDLQATVEAGIPRKQFVKALANTGFTFFIDPGADATIGGMTSTRASGTTAVRYARCARMSWD